MTVRLANGMVDVDGTLLDILDRFAGAMRGAFADKVTRLPGWNAIRAILGRSLCTAVATLAAAATAGRHARRVAGHSEAFAPAQARPARRAPLQPEAAAMPGPLSTDPGVVPDVATGMPRHGLSRRLDPPALPGVIATLQCADGHRAKPHPSMAPACLAHAKVAPGDAVLVGDTALDLGTAGAAAIAAVRVTWGDHPVARAAQLDAAIGRVPSAGPRHRAGAVAGTGAAP